MGLRSTAKADCRTSSSLRPSRPRDVYAELEAIGVIVDASGDVSAIASYNVNSAKILLLTGASYFERSIVAAIEDHLNTVTPSLTIRHFTFHQSVDRKFFSLFDFSASNKNISGFLSKFGPDFSEWAKEDMRAQGIDADTQAAFLAFCRLRNNLVHNNFATYNIDKTLADVRADFDKALKLVSWVENCLRRFHEAVPPVVADNESN